MSSEVAIRVENVSKRYHLRHPVTTDTGEETHELWALKDVSFEIKKGESVGIIGPNGSGKSTLLKILAGVTKPTSGKVEIFGRVASILDIGAGFHPELSGRDNVFFNGQIHGFSKKEIAAKFDAIVEFSGIEKFIDEPVKNYSNGMYLRLAFSIMAHLDFDVYLFDEVINVGDLEFKNKMKKIQEEWKFSFKTILIASHEHFELLKISDKFLFSKSNKYNILNIDEALIFVNQGFARNNKFILNFENDFISIHEIWIENENKSEVIKRTLPFSIKVSFTPKLELNKTIEFACRISKDGFPFLIRYFSLHNYEETENGKNVSFIEIPPLFLNRGFYSIDLFLGDTNVEYYHKNECITFEVINDSNEVIGVIDPICIRERLVI